MTVNPAVRCLVTVLTVLRDVIFTIPGAFCTLPTIIREAVMIERELGNWKDFIEDMLRK